VAPHQTAQYHNGDVAALLFRGDTVLVKGKKRKDTILIVLTNDDSEDGNIGSNQPRYQKQPQSES
jgi:hypothetical protein